MPGLLGALIAGLIAAQVGIAGASTASNQRAAQSKANSMMAALRLPAGAVQSASDPSSQRVLGQPFMRPGTPALVEIHRFWVVPGSPRAVLNWIKANPPTGSNLNGGGAMTSHGVVVTREANFDFPGSAAVLSLRELVITVAQAQGDQTALRADSQAVWVVDRPAGERVPSGVRVVTITVRYPRGGVVKSETLTRPRQVRHVVLLVDRLPATQPGIFHCPAGSTRSPIVTLRFRRAAGSPPVAVVVASGGGCGGVSFALRGHQEPPLADGHQLIVELGLSKYLPGP